MLKSTNQIEIMNKVSSRIFKRKKAVLNTVFASLIATTMSVSALAGPTDGNVVSGNATIGGSGNATDINQSSKNAIINWGSFSIGANEVVNIFNGSGATLNRVVGQSVSQILGALNATGSAYLINENGVVVGPEGQISVGGSFIGSTRDVSNADFLNGGTLSFAGDSDAAVVNLGNIEAAGGDVYMIGGSAFNEGIIKAGGNVGLVAADEVVLMVNGNNGVNYSIISSESNTSDNGTAIDRGNPLALAINGAGGNSDISVVNGRIVNNSGSITAGGNAVLTGAAETQLASTSNINVGGSAYIGGGYQGQTDLGFAQIPASMRTKVNAGSQVKSNGGDVIYWSNGLTTYSGSTNTIGENGDGFVEVSGHDFELNSWDIQTGEFLLDPTEINIVASTSGAITDETSSVNTIGANQIVAFLESETGKTLTVKTLASDAGSGDINVNSDVTWNSANSTLRMDAHNDININDTIDGSASGNAKFIASAQNDINVNSDIKVGDSGSIQLNAAVDNIDANRTSNWKAGEGSINFGDVELNASRLTLNSGKVAGTTGRADMLENVKLTNGSGTMGSVQVNGFENVDVNFNSNSDYESEQFLLVNAKNINIDENMDVSGAFMLNGAAFDDTTGNFVEYQGNPGGEVYNQLGGFNGSGWKENSGVVTFENGTELSLCCGVTINSGLDANGNRIDLTKDQVTFKYNRDHDIYKWFQVHGYDKFETKFENNAGNNVLQANDFVDIQNGENLIDFDIETAVVANTGNPDIDKGFTSAGNNPDVLIVSERDTNVVGSNINSAGNVTIVVDEQNPTLASGFGNGSLNIDAASTINSGGTTALYTAVQGQNNIDGTINGATFTKGEEFQTSSVEEWLTYYQGSDNSQGSSPYKVLYKNGPTLGGIDCSNNPDQAGCENFVSVLDNRREYRVALSGEGNDVGEEVLAIGTSEDLRNNEFYTAMDPNYVDTHLNTNEKFGLLYSVPLNLLSTALIDGAIPGIQGLASLVTAPISAVTGN